MRLAATQLDATDLAFVLALTMRRLGQEWRRNERASADSWLSYADRVGPELLPEGLRAPEVGRMALALAGAVLAGLWPSWKMSRTPPSRALRGE